MTLDVAESILGVFGFSGTQLGFKHGQRNFLEELRGERDNPAKLTQNYSEVIKKVAGDA
jgi:hypothetical protein